MAAAILTKEGVESGKGADLYGSLAEFELALPEDELREYKRRCCCVCSVCFLACHGCAQCQVRSKSPRRLQHGETRFGLQLSHENMG